ncbi:hypothetical protein LJC26_03515 [Desulfovibrio sp. OttesenSCG-928-O18]|nr:hypothetical protein [Desulfovibrio sp. OttesenSCG-928-O18]
MSKEKLESSYDSIIGKDLEGTPESDTAKANAIEDSTIDLLGGNNKLQVKGDISSSLITAEDGADTITASILTDTTINLGNGNNVLTAGWMINMGGGGIEAGNGNDSITFSNALLFSTVDLGDGKNTFSAGWARSSAITSGSGDDAITLASAETSTISAGAGNDTITITGTRTVRGTPLAADVQVDGGDGRDVLKVSELGMAVSLEDVVPGGAAGIEIIDFTGGKATRLIIHESDLAGYSSIQALDASLLKLNAKETGLNASDLAGQELLRIHGNAKDSVGFAMGEGWTKENSALVIYEGVSYNVYKSGSGERVLVQSTMKAAMDVVDKEFVFYTTPSDYGQTIDADLFTSAGVTVSAPQVFPDNLKGKLSSTITCDDGHSVRLTFMDAPKVTLTAEQTVFSASSDAVYSVKATADSIISINGRLLAKSSITGSAASDLVSITVDSADPAVLSSTIHMGEGNNDLYITTKGDGGIAVSGSTLKGGAGADTFNISADAAIGEDGTALVSSTVDMGNGNNNLTIDGAVGAVKSTIKGGNGNDNVTSNALLDNTTVSLGAGDNRVSVEADGHAISRGSVTTGAGDDDLTFTTRTDTQAAVAGTAINAGNGNNTVIITGGISSATVAGKVYAASIKTGTGTDSISITSAASGSAAMQGVTLTDTGGKNELIITATGSDMTAVADSKITLAGRSEVTISAQEEGGSYALGNALVNSSLKLTGDHNIVSLQGDINNSTITLALFDTFDVSSGSVFRNSTLTAKNGYVAASLQDIDNSELTFGSQKDRLVINGNIEGKTKIDTGAGADLVTVFGNVSADTTINLGAGNDSLYIPITGATMPKIQGTFDGGAGEDTLFLPNDTGGSASSVDLSGLFDGSGTFKGIEILDADRFSLPVNNDLLSCFAPGKATYVFVNYVTGRIEKFTASILRVNANDVQFDPNEQWLQTGSGYGDPSLNVYHLYENAAGKQVFVSQTATVGGLANGVDTTYANSAVTANTKDWSAGETNAIVGSIVKGGTLKLSANDGDTLTVKGHVQNTNILLDQEWDPAQSLGSANDVLTIRGNVTSSVEVDEDEKVYAYEISGIGGDDTVYIGGNLQANIFLGDGADQITIGGNVVSSGGAIAAIETGDGDDTIIINGKATADIDLGDGSNSLRVGGDLTNSWVSLAGDNSDDNTVTINGSLAGKSTLLVGGGADEITIAKNAAGTIDTGAGSDTVTIKGNATANIALGDGDNSLSVGGTASGLITAEGTSENTVTIGKTFTGVLDFQNSGDDFVAIGGDMSKALVLGGGDAEVHIHGAAKGNIVLGTQTVNHATGALSGPLTVSDGQSTVTVDGALSGSITGSNGGNEITVKGAVTGSIKGGDGNDTFAIGGMTKGSIQAGDGDDTLILNIAASKIASLTSLFSGLFKADAVQGVETLVINIAEGGKAGTLTLNKTLAENLAKLGATTIQIDGNVPVVLDPALFVPNDSLGDGKTRYTYAGIVFEFDGPAISYSAPSAVVDWSNTTDPMDIALAGSAKSITLGEGDDKLAITKAIGKPDIKGGDIDDVISTGEGNDSITIGTLQSYEIHGGDGNDTITVTRVTDADIFGGNGNDSIHIGTANDLVVAGGDGNDTIYVAMLDKGGCDIYGDNTDKTGAGNDHIIIGGIKRGYINGGDGDDTLTLLADGTAKTFATTFAGLVTAEQGCRVRNIEKLVVDMSGSKADTLTLDKATLDKFAAIAEQNPGIGVWLKGDDAGVADAVRFTQNPAGYTRSDTPVTGEDGNLYTEYTYNGVSIYVPHSMKTTHADLSMQDYTLTPQNLTFTNLSSDIVTGSHNDTVKITYTLKDATVDLGDGNNALTVKTVDTTANNTSLHPGGFIDYIGLYDKYTGDDPLTSDRFNIYNTTIKAGDGNDTVTVTGNLKGNIDLGDGDNELTVKGKVIGVEDSDINYGSPRWTEHLTVSTIKSGDGDDTVQINDVGYNYFLVNLGDGKNKIDITSKGGKEFAVDMVTGSGNDSITITAARGVEASGLIDAGDGDNTIHINGISDFRFIHTGDGNDSIHVTGNSDTKFFLGSGNNTLRIDGDCLKNLITSEHDGRLDSGNDSIYIGGSIETDDGVVAMLYDGNDTLHVGGDILLLPEEDSRTWVELGYEGDKTLVVGGSIGENVHVVMGKFDGSEDHHHTWELETTVSAGTLHATVGNLMAGSSISGGDGDDTIILGGMKGGVVMGNWGFDTSGTDTLVLQLDGKADPFGATGAFSGLFATELYFCDKMEPENVLGGAVRDMDNLYLDLTGKTADRLDLSEAALENMRKFASANGDADSDGLSLYIRGDVTGESGAKHTDTVNLQSTDGTFAKADITTTVGDVEYTLYTYTHGGISQDLYIETELQVLLNGGTF